MRDKRVARPVHTKNQKTSRRYKKRKKKKEEKRTYMHEKFYRGGSCRIKAGVRLLLFLEQPSAALDEGRAGARWKVEATLSPL